MKYQFANITHVDQVREALGDREEFIVADREWGIVANYLVNFEDTFPTPNTKDPVLNEHYAIRRECRGLKFGLDGKILARPFHKFFNFGEKPEVSHPNVDWDADFSILEKLDGSMIHPIFVNNQIVWCTKMGATDVALPVYDFVEAHPQYATFARDCFHAGKTPIFEWCSRKQRIVVDYPVDRLVLTAVRDNVSGEYATYTELQEWGRRHNLDVVAQYDGTWEGIEHFRNTVQEHEGEEGYIIRFADGHMLKIKNLWYLQLHKTKELMQFEKDVWALVLDDKYDDAKAFMEAEETHQLDSFAHDLLHALDATADRLNWVVIAAKDNLNDSKKRFATEIVANHPVKDESSILFKIWDGYDAKEVVRRMARDNCGTGTKLEKVRHLANGIRWDQYYRQQGPLDA